VWSIGNVLNSNGTFAQNMAAPRTFRDCAWWWGVAEGNGIAVGGHLKVNNKPWKLWVWIASRGSM